MTATVCATPLPRPWTSKGIVCCLLDAVVVKVLVVATAEGVLLLVSGRRDLIVAMFADLSSYGKAQVSCEEVLVTYRSCDVLCGALV